MGKLQSELYGADNAEWILLRAFCSICNVPNFPWRNTVAATWSALAPARASALYSVARLGAAPVCQSLHKQKPDFPLWTNQHLFSIRPRLWSAPSPVTFQRVSLSLPCSLSLCLPFTHVWIKSFTSLTTVLEYSISLSKLLSLRQRQRLWILFEDRSRPQLWRCYLIAWFIC